MSHSGLEEPGDAPLEDVLEYTAENKAHSPKCLLPRDLDSPNTYYILALKVSHTYWPSSLIDRSKCFQGYFFFHLITKRVPAAYYYLPYLKSSRGLAQLSHLLTGITATSPG